MAERTAEERKFKGKEWVPTGYTYLIIGQSGLIGTQFSSSISVDKVYGLSRGNIPSPHNTFYSFIADATKKTEVKDILLKISPDIIIDLGGMTNLDECQKDFNSANYANTVRVRSIIKAINCYTFESKKPPIYLLGSTDCVYGSSGPHTEISPRRPTIDSSGTLGYYAITKMWAEEIVENEAHKSGIPYVILRYANPYSQKYREKITTPAYMFETLAQGCVVAGLTDFKMTPTPAEYIPVAVNKLILAKVWEDENPVYNVAGKEILSGYEIAQICADELERRGIKIDRERQIKASTVEEFFRGRAPRQINGGVITDKLITKVGDIFPPLSEVLQSFTLPG